MKHYDYTLQKNIAGRNVKEHDVLEIKKFKMSEIDKNLEEAAMQLKTFELIGFPGMEIFSQTKVQPSLKIKLQQKMQKLQDKNKAVKKPVVLKTPRATRIKSRINYAL